MAKLRKKRCPFCPKRFWPHPRVGARQWACRKPECQKARRAQTQKAWREKNPDYWKARRLQQRSAAAKAAAQQAAEVVRNGRPVAGGSSTVRPPPVPPVPRELGALPWSFAHAELGVATTDFLILMLKVVLLHVQDQIERQDQIEAQVPDST
ncbi:MAG: hypothetical protein GY769_21675 [bacterium]|nr:hypothetical protein [bacterium]